MRSELEERLESSGVADLWRRRAEGVKERQALQERLSEVRTGITFWDRVRFWHTSEAEGEEKKTQARIDDLTELVVQATASIEKFWAELAQGSEKYARVLALEEALRAALLAFDSATLKKAREDCKKIVLDQLAQIETSTLAEEEIEPGQALARLFSRPEQAYLRPLCCLGELLKLSEPLRESQWSGFRITLLYRPLLIQLVDRSMALFRQGEPDNAFPVDILLKWMTDSQVLSPPTLPPLLAEIPGSDERAQDLLELESLLEQLAGHRLLLRLTRQKISLLDRIVFWSDTPAEAREKSLLEQGESLCEQIAGHWEAFERDTRGHRRESWRLYVCDQALLVRDAVRNISTPGGESSWKKACPLQNQEPAAWAVQLFRSELTQRFGSLGNRDELIRSVVSAPDADTPWEPDPLGFPPILRLSEVLRPLLSQGDFFQQQREFAAAEQERQRLEQELASAGAGISTWDRVNVFSETRAEALERESSQALRQLADRQRELRDQLCVQLEDSMARAHRPALIALLVDELGRAIDEVRAECDYRIETYTDSDGDERTRRIYFCVLRGMDVAAELLRRLLEASWQEGYLPLWATVEAWALQRAENRSAIDALSLAQTD